MHFKARAHIIFTCCASVLLCIAGWLSGCLIIIRSYRSKATVYTVDSDDRNSQLS